MTRSAPAARLVRQDAQNGIKIARGRAGEWRPKPGVFHIGCIAATATQLQPITSEGGARQALTRT